MKPKQNPENYLIFARKFRPQTFDEVVGQEPITTTLKNAISKGRIAQSFLFTGSRGVGKTSTARIFAKALNCEKGPSPTPCNQCSICEEITQGISLDILEIDGASNRGIDEIRNLRENVKFKPARGRYKVYIIDEVHMLTGEAFNALLKTLEEPPEHVKFIFATTEVHKVPLTILSRCQRFNFRRIPTDEMVEKLKEIAKEEKIKVSAKALFMIAKSSEGSLRDAESLLDQLASSSGGEIKESDITFSLGLADTDIYFSLLESLKAKDAKAVLHLVNEIAEQGKDLIQFSKGLLELFRNLLVLAVGEGTEKLVESAEDELDQLVKMKNDFSREELLFALTLLQQLSREIRWSDTPRFLVESCLLKIASRADLRSIDDILKELKSLQKNTPAVLTSQPKFESPQALMQSAKAKKGTGSDVLPAPFFEEPQKAPERKKEKGTTSSVTLSDVGRVWPDLLERVKALKMSCGTYLSESEPVEVVDGLVVFGFPSEFKFHKEALEKQAHKDLIRSTLKSLLGTEINISFVLTEPAKEPAKKVESSLPAKDSEIITSALNMFDGSKVVHRDP
ncbi:MAG: DNA polymerase III subunit gamma/tau [Candidatus Omnitrophica bacterium]|nr:DNA polymerase III subunit gamma/tau [Candidatus Omnitrophota bacterium]